MSSVQGRMPTMERRHILAALEDQPPTCATVVASCRCLLEGIDVPELDGIAFFDPKGSSIEIAQGIGRAIRKSGNKNVSSVILPVVVPAEIDDASYLLTSQFKKVIQVLYALRALDDRFETNARNSLKRSAPENSADTPNEGAIHLDINLLTPKAKEVITAKVLRFATGDLSYRLPELKKALSDYAQSLGKTTLSVSDFENAIEKKLVPSTWTIQRITGCDSRSLYKLLEVLGLAEAEEATLQPKAKPTWSRASGIEALKNYAKSLGKTALDTLDVRRGSISGACPSVTWIARLLDPKGKTVSKGLEAIGLYGGKAHKVWTVDSGLRAIDEYARALGISKLAYADVRMGSPEGICPSTKWIIRHFGSKEQTFEEAIGAIDAILSKQRQVESSEQMQYPKTDA